VFCIKIVYDEIRHLNYSKNCGTDLLVVVQRKINTIIQAQLFSFAYLQLAVKMPCHPVTLAYLFLSPADFDVACNLVQPIRIFKSKQRVNQYRSSHPTCVFLEYSEVPNWMNGFILFLEHPW